MGPRLMAGKKVNAPTMSTVADEQENEDGAGDWETAGALGNGLLDRQAAGQRQAPAQ